MATELNILEDASAGDTEEVDRHLKVAQFDSIPDVSAPAGSIVNQTLTKMSKNENEHKKQEDIKGAETGSKKNEIIDDFNLEERDHEIAKDQHFQVITNEHVNREVISESTEKEIMTLDKDKIPRSKGEKDSNLEESREQATSILEANLGAKNDDNVRVEESCIKDQDIDNNFSDNIVRVEVEGKDIESLQSGNKLENELIHDKTEDASINVAETPYIHHGEEDTPEAAIKNEDDNSNKLENQPSDLATDEASTLGVALETGESLKEASSESCIEIKEDIHESKSQEKDVPPVEEIKKAEDSTLLKSNKGGGNGEVISHIGLEVTNEDRKINTEKEDGDKRGSWQQGELQEKLEGDFVLIPEKSEIAAAGENVEMSTQKLHPCYEEKEEKEEPASTSTSEEMLSSTEKNLPLVESITQSASAEIEFPEKNRNDLNSEYSVVEKTMQQDSGETVEVKTQAQEDNQDSSKPYAHNKEEIEYQSEAQSEGMVSEDNKSEQVIMETILQSNEAVEEPFNVPESSNSDEKIEIKDGGKIIPDKAKEREEDTDMQTQKTAAQKDENTIRDRTIEQSFQEESPKDAEPPPIDIKNQRLENDAERHAQVLEAFDQPKTAVREEISKHVISGSDEETINIFRVKEIKSQNIGEGTSGEAGEENNMSNLPPKFTEKQEESVLREFSEKNAGNEDEDADIKPICEEYSKKMLQNDEKEKVEEVVDITTEGSKAGDSGENPESTDSVGEGETTTTLEKISRKEEKIRPTDDRMETEAENQEVQVFETTEASQATTESVLEACEKSETDAPESKPQAKEIENTVVCEMSPVTVDIEQGKEYREEDESHEIKIKEEVEETYLTESKVNDTSDDFSEPKEDNDALNTEENDNSLVEVSTSTLAVFETDDFIIKDSEAASLEDVREKPALKEVKSLNEDQLEASDASPHMKDSTTIETKENSPGSGDSDERKDKETHREEKRDKEIPEMADEGGQQISHEIKDQALPTSTPLLEVQLEQTLVEPNILPSKEDHKTTDQTIAGNNDSYVDAKTPCIVHFKGSTENKKDNADEEIDHKSTVEDQPIEQREREEVIVLADQNEANQLDIVEDEKSTVELVKSMGSENAVAEEEELAERTEDSPKVVVEERGQEETTAALERISRKENIEENNDHLVEISTSTLGVFKKDELGTNDSEAVSLGDVNEKAVMKEVQSLIEEQPKISDISPDMRDSTTTETKAIGPVSVDIDESKEKEAETEEYREVEVLEVEDEGRQQISHDMKDQASNTGISDETTSTALSEVQLEQTFADSDSVPLKEDSKTIQTSKTISGDDALYIDAETPFITCFEHQPSDDQENADEFDQKNLVEDQPMEQREKEQVMILGDQNEANKLEIVEDENLTVAVTKQVEVVASMNSENAVPEDMELAEKTEESSEVVVEKREEQEETAATLERISEKENIEEKMKATDDTKENEAENQEVQVFETTESSQATEENILEVCERPKTDASESKTDDNEINNTVDSGTQPSVSVEIEKGENESSETKIKEEVETTITNVSDDFSINNSKAASLEDTEKSALKDVKSLNEEQLEASDSSPDMNGFTTIETAADSLGNVDILERKEKQTNTEEKRDIEVSQVTDGGEQKIYRGIKDQAWTTGTPLIEDQLEQTSVDSDKVPSVEDPQTIETSKATDKTIGGDDAPYVDAETPFIAHLEVSSDNRKENVDEETDQKSMVEDQPIEQREREQVIILADDNEANKLEITKDKKSAVEVSKHIEVVTSTNSENIVLEGEEVAERTEDSPGVVVERGQEETASKLERISQKENVEENMKAINEMKENKAENGESFNELQHDRNDENISCESNQNVVSPDEVLDISLKKQEETVLGESKDNDVAEAQDAKIISIGEECSKKMLQNDEKEKVEEFADIITEESKQDASGDNPESAEFIAKEATSTTLEEISQKEKGKENIKSVDDDTKEKESENQELQVLVTTEASQTTAESIVEPYEKSKIDASESKSEDRETENTVGSGTLSSVSVDTEKGKEFPEENKSGDTKMKEEVEETSLTETKVTDTLHNFSEPKGENDALTTDGNNNKLVEISTSTLGVFEKDDFGTNGSETTSLQDVSEKPDMTHVKSLNEKQPEISDASHHMKDLTTIETKASSPGRVDFDERNDKETDTEDNRDIKVLEMTNEGGQQISHDIKDQALTTGTLLSEVPLDPTFVDSDMMQSKEDPETTEMSKTTDKIVAGDDVSYIDADTAFDAHIKGSSDITKDKADEEIDEKNTAEEDPIEQKERAQVIASADQIDANELKIDKDEKSTVEVSKHIEVVRIMNSENAVLDEQELAERTEDSSEVMVEREGQEETSATLERISQKENVGEKVTAKDDTKEAASREVLFVTTAGSEATAENILKVSESSNMQASESKPEEEIENTVGTSSSNSVGTGTGNTYTAEDESYETLMRKEVEVTNAESENQTEVTNLMDRNISNASDDTPEKKEDHGNSTTEQNNHTLVENSSSISEVSDKDDKSTNGSKNECVRVVTENTTMKEGNTENEEQLKGSDAVPDKKDVTTIETEEISSSSFNNDERQEEESSSENVPAVVQEVISHEAHQLEICKDERPIVEVSKYTELSQGENNKSELLEEEELSEKTEKSAALAVIGEEKEAAEPKAGSPSSEEPAITKNIKLLIEKSLQSDESERKESTEDKDKDAMINLKDDFTNANDGEENVEDLSDMNGQHSKEETKITVEKISQIEEKEVRSIDDTEKTEAAYQEIPVTDAAGQATGENNLKVCETLNTEASVSNPQEEGMENIIQTFPSASVRTEAGKQHPHVDADNTKLQQEVEVRYLEYKEQIEATSLKERKTSISLDNYLKPKEDHGPLTTEENINNLVDNASPPAGALEKDESNIIDSETEFPGVTSDKTTIKGDKPVNEEQPEVSNVATQTKDVTTIERGEEETNPEEKKGMEVPEVTDEGLQQKPHQIEEKAEITSLDHEKESSTSTQQLDDQLGQTNIESSMVSSKEEPETIEPSKTAEYTPASDEEKEREDDRNQKHKDRDNHMPLDLKTEDVSLDTEDIEQLQREQVSGLEDQNEASKLEIVKDEKSSVEVSKDIEVVTCITSKNIANEEEETAARTEDNSAVGGVEREAAELKEGTPSSEEGPAGTKSSELLAQKISVTDGASQATGENSLKVSETSNTEVSVLKPKEEIENTVGTIPSAQVNTEAGKECPQVHTSETKLQQEVEVTYAESSKEQIEATPLIERKFSSTLNNVSQLKDDHGDLTTEENNNTLVDNNSRTARAYKKDESEIVSITSDETILKDNKPVTEDQPDVSDAATQMKDITTIETKKISSVSYEKQEEETNSEENKSMEVPKVADEGLQQVSHHIEEKVEIKGPDHEKESTSSPPQLDEQLVQTKIDSNMVPSKEDPETVKSSKTTEEKSTAEVSKDIGVVTRMNDKTVVVEEEELTERTKDNSAVTGVEREAAELNEGTPSSEEEPAKTKSSDLQEEKVEVMNEESKEQHEVTSFIERNLSTTLDELSEPKGDHGPMTTKENNDLVDNSSTSVGVLDKDENGTNESSVVSSKEVAETIESSKETEDTQARDEEKEREDDKDQKHNDQAKVMPSNLKTEDDILDTENIDQLKREQVCGLEVQNEASDLEIVKDEKSSIMVSKDIEVVTCINSKSFVPEEEEIAARAEDNSMVGGVEREVAEQKEDTPSSEEPTKTQTSELLEEKVEIAYEDYKPVNEDVCDAATHTKDVTTIETEASSSIVNNDERQEEETNSEENRNMEVREVTDEGGQKMSDDIKEKDVITFIHYEKELTISTSLLDEQLAQTYMDSSMVPSKEDQESVVSSNTTEETAAIDEKSTSFEISRGASILASSDNEKENADGRDQKHKDQDHLMSPDQESKNDISDADQNEMGELEIVKDEKGEVLKQIEDATGIKGEETVLKEEEHTERTEESSAVIGVEEEPGELKEGSPISEEEPPNTKNSEVLLEKGHHAVETTHIGSIKEELKEQSIISAEEEEGTEVKVLDSEFKRHTQAKDLTEEKESVTSKDHTKQSTNTIDISSLTSTDISETSNKDSSSISKVHEREAAAEVLKKDEPTFGQDTKHMSVRDTIDETGMKNVAPEHEEQDKGSDFVTETTILNEEGIRERQEEDFSTEQTRILEEADSCHLKTDHCVEETDKSTSVQHEREVATDLVLNFQNYPQRSLEEKDTNATEITDKAEETLVTEHTTENKLLQNELDVAKQGIYEVETEKNNASEKILEQTSEPESNETESDAVSAADNTVTKVTARNSESTKQIASLNNFAKINEDVSSLTTIEESEEETCGEESKQTLLRDSDNEKQKADGEDQKHMGQDELMLPDLKTTNVISCTEDIEQWKREQVSGLADQNEACELEIVKVEKSTAEVPKDVEVATSTKAKDVLKEQDLAERAEENSAIARVEREAPELKEVTLSCEVEPVKTKSSELLAEKVEVTYEESKKQQGASDDLPAPKEDCSSLTTEEKNGNLVDNSSSSVGQLEKDENSTNDSDNAAIDNGKPVNKDQGEVSKAATETKNVTIIETEAHSSSVNNDERQEEETANSKEDQGSVGSSKTTKETPGRDDSTNVNAKMASFEISQGHSILENSDNEEEIDDRGDQKHKDQDQHMPPYAKSENDMLDTENIEQWKTEQVSGLADQNDTRELVIVKDKKLVDEVSKHIEDATCIKGEKTVVENDEHTGRTEDSPAIIEVGEESAEGSPISAEEPTNTKNAELIVEKVHHTVETADKGNIKEELMESRIISAKVEEGIEIQVLNSELKQQIEDTKLTKEKETVALEDHREASETCNEESSSITKVYEREAEAEVLKKDESITDDDTKHVSLTVAIEEKGSKDVATEHEEQDKGSNSTTENESVTTITTESTVLNAKDIHERQEEDSSMEKKRIPEEDDCRLKTDYCVEETDKTSTMQHEREVTTSSVSDSQDYPQRPLEEKDIYVTEEMTDKAAETYLNENTAENKLLQNEDEAAKQEDVFEVDTERSNASENILDQTTEPESNATESDVVSSADKTVNEVTATTSESIKQIESLENFSKENEDVSSFTTIEGPQEETHGEESKKSLFRISSLESWEAEKDNKAEIIKKDDTGNASETLPQGLVGEGTVLNKTLGEDNKQENNFSPVTEARDVTSTDTVNSRLDTINTDCIQEKSSCSEKNGEKQSPEIADEALQEIHEDVRQKAPPKRIEHEEDSSFTPILQDNLQSSLVTQAEGGGGSFTNSESPFVVHAMEEKLTESNPDVIKPEVSAVLDPAAIGKESEDNVIQNLEDEDFSRPHIVNNQTTKSHTKDIETTRTAEDSSLTTQSEACTLAKGEEPCLEALKHRTDGTFTDDEKVSENLKSSSRITEGWAVAAALDSGGQSDHHDPTKIQKIELSVEKDHLIQDSTSKDAESIPRQQFPSEKGEKIEIESQVEHHLHKPLTEEETSTSSLTTKEVHGGFDRAGGNESNDNIKEQIVDSEVRLIELQTSSARDEAVDEVQDCNLSSTETLKAEDSNKQALMVESSIKEDHPTTTVDASEQNLAVENVDADQGEEFMGTYEFVSKDEIIDDKLLPTIDKEKLQNQTSASLERKQEQGIQVTSQNTVENSKAMETFDHNISDSKTAEETCWEKDDSIKFIDHNSGAKINEDSQMDGSRKSHEKSEALDVIIKPYEIGEKECIDSLSESQKIAEETKPEKALSLKTGEKAFEYVQEVHIDKAVIELENREYPIKTAITDLQPEENQSEKTIAAEKTTDAQVLDEKITEETEGGKLFLQHFLCKTRQENEPEAVDPLKKMNETFQTINNDNRHEVKLEALKKDEVEVFEDKLPCDVEGKNITEAATLNNQNQDAEINVATRGVLMSQSEEESGVKTAKGHVTEENENTQDIKKLEEGFMGKADVESNGQHNRRTTENVLQVLQLPNEETRLEVSPENAEPGRAGGISLILEGTKVGEEKHLGDVLNKKSTSIDAEKTFNISERSTEEPLQATIHLDETTEKAVCTGVEKTQEEVIPHVEDDKMEVVSGATQIVESCKDVDIKVAHKKHHKILSGVGSKVKHSISKVKKAITGKSSHSKSSPK